MCCSLNMLELTKWDALKIFLPVQKQRRGRQRAQTHFFSYFLCAITQIKLGQLGFSFFEMQAEIVLKESKEIGENGLLLPFLLFDW